MRIRKSHELLETLEAHLKDRKWLASEQASIADISNYTYIAHAPEGNVSLNGYPSVRAWLERVEVLPGFIAMQSTAAGMAV